MPRLLPVDALIFKPVYCSQSNTLSRIYRRQYIFDTSDDDDDRRPCQHTWTSSVGRVRDGTWTCLHCVFH